jgi:hypothetical protein
VRAIGFAIIILLLSLFSAYLIVHIEPLLSLSIIILTTILILTFINPDVGLCFFIISILFSPEIEIFKTELRPATIRFEDATIIGLFLVLLGRTAILKGYPTFVSTPFNRPIIIYSLCCIFSTLLGGLFNTGIKFQASIFYLLKYIEYFLMFFVISSYIENEKQIKLFIFFIILTGFIFSVFMYSEIPRGGRVSGLPLRKAVGEDANTVGGYLVFLYGFIFAFILYIRSWLIRFVLIIVGLVMAFPLVYTLSRGSYVAFIVMCISFIFIAKGKRLLSFLMILLLIIFVIAFIPPRALERVKTTISPQWEGSKLTIGDISIPLEPSAYARVYFYQWAYEIWKEYPIFGTGVGIKGVVDAQIPRVIAETGTIGIISFLYLLLKILQIAQKRKKEAHSPFYKGLTCGFLAGTIGLITHSLFAATFILIRIMEAFWFVAAIISVLDRIKLTQKEVSQESLPF